MRKKVVLLFFFICFGFFAKTKASLVRFPSISPDGKSIAFVYQGDIWISTDNKRPYRLTVHKSYDSYPKWSNDGKMIAFESNRYGNKDIFVVPSDGGNPKRLTYYSDNDQIGGWTNDGRILFGSSRLNVHVERLKEMLVISPQGGTPKLAFNSLGYTPVESPDGTKIAFVRGSCKIEREDYNGPANKDIWIYNKKDGSFSQITEDKGNDFNPQWQNENTLFFISAKDGNYNINKVFITPDGKKQKEQIPVTSFTDDGVRYFSLAANGKKIVFERQASIFVLNLPINKIEKQIINILGENHLDDYEYKTFRGEVENYSISPNGRYAAFEIRGEIFIKENDEQETTAINVTKHPFRDRDVAWVNDSTLIFSSDRDGQYDLFLLKSADPKQGSLLSALRYNTIKLTNTKKDEGKPVVSPNNKKVAFVRGNGNLIVADISDDKLEKETVLVEGWSSPQYVSWSPDNKWLAFSMEDLNDNSDIYIQAVDKSASPINVSMYPRLDTRPVWSPDGSKLAFISIRNNNDNDIWFVWLRKSDWQRTKFDWKEKEKGDKRKKAEKLEDIRIDLEDIHERVVQVTSLPGNENDIAFSKDGETIYFVTNGYSRFYYEADRDLYSIKWDGSGKKALTNRGEAPYSLVPDYKNGRLFMLKSSKLASIDLKNNKLTNYGFHAKMKIDFEREKEQKFEEAWRAINNRFYDPNFHGKDWQKLKGKYKSWCMQASTEEDFRDMFNFLLGQINASHMGMRGISLRSESSIHEKTGEIGTDIEPLDKGVRIKRVIPNSPADKEFSKLYPGEVISHIDGTEITENINFYSLLNQKVNERVILKVNNKKGVAREVVIRPVKGLSDQLYEEWVMQRKKLVEEYSGGKLGYIHIEGMNWTSFERFEREIMASGYHKKGIVIDVRFNGGGWTTDFLMAVLSVKQHAYVVPRGAAKNLEKEKRKFRDNYAFGARLPLSSWTKPSIVMCNANSYSNAEIFSHAYKQNGLGKLVGIPTFGAVISTGAEDLIDGSYIRMPYRGWFVKNTDENMENGPAVPHIILDNDPDSKFKGIDPQLKRSVEELLKEID